MAETGRRVQINRTGFPLCTSVPLPQSNGGESFPALIIWWKMVLLARVDTNAGIYSSPPETHVSCIFFSMDSSQCYPALGLHSQHALLLAAILICTRGKRTIDWGGGCLSKATFSQRECMCSEAKNN